MRIRVNGKEIEIDEVHTVDSLLEKLGYTDRFLAVAVNQQCILKKRYAEERLRAGDDIEILAPMAGG